MELGKAEVTKCLIKLPSSNLAESIYFDRPEKQVICISTQLNCSVGCLFCASSCDTGTINLSVEDMLYQFDWMDIGNKDKLMLYSFMGEGEPFLNYKNVLETMRILDKRHDCRISVSTSGYKIREFALEEFNKPVKLQVSVHAANYYTRKKLMPNAPDTIRLKEAIKYFNENSNKLLDLNFTLIDGINDSLQDMQHIIDKFPDNHIKISKYNSVDNVGMKSSTRVDECINFLKESNMDVEYHETDGADIAAACGQTRGKKRLMGK